jgi:calcium-dependent protein kinase
MDIMHRDLKPDNLILISKDDLELFDFKVVDFGLATFVNTKKHIYKKCGTPGFVAPEVFTTSDGKYTNKCDVFSAGCILH